MIDLAAGVESRTSRGYLVLKSLEVRNFRCFERLSLDDLRRINIIVGENASGKTALLEALWVLCSSEPRFFYRPNKWRGAMPMGDIQIHPAVNAFSDVWSNFFYRQDMNRQIEIVAHDSDRGKRSLLVKIDGTGQSSLFDNESGELVGSNQSFESKRVAPLSFTWQNPDGVSEMIVSSNGSITILKEMSNGHWPLSFLSPQNPHTNKEDVLKFSHLENNKRNFSLIQSAMSKEFNVTDLGIGLYLDEPTIFGDLSPGDKGKPKMPIAFHSSGAKRFLSIVLAIAYLENGLVAVDEIENGFYFERYGDLWRIFYEYCSPSRFNCQLFASTHSSECLKAAQPLIEKYPNDFCLLRPEGSGDKRTVRRLEGETLRKALIGGFEVR